MSHRNASLSVTGRLRLARCVVDEGWPFRRAAERFQVAVTTAGRWAGRYHEFGEAGMADRSSRPHRSPTQTPTRTERRIKASSVGGGQPGSQAAGGCMTRPQPSWCSAVPTSVVLPDVGWVPENVD